MQLVLIVALLFAVLVAIFAIQNTAAVGVTLFFWTIEAVSVSILILASAAVGAVLAFLLGLGRIIRSAVEDRRHRRSVADLEAKIAELERRVDEKDRELASARATTTKIGPSPGAQKEPLGLQSPTAESEPAQDPPIQSR